jgi:hypothetical protein
VFDDFYKFRTFYIDVENLEELDADFLQGSEVSAALNLINGRIGTKKNNTVLVI